LLIDNLAFLSYTLCWSVICLREIMENGKEGV
jgi:hypothetical protein